MRHLLLPIALFAAAAAALPVHAQGKPQKREQPAMVPVWNQASGKLEAVLLLEPKAAGLGSQLRFNDTTLDAAFGLDAGNALGLVCDRGLGLGVALAGLVGNCEFASFEAGERRRAVGSAGLTRGDTRLGVGAGAGRDTLPAWLAPPGRAGSQQVEVNDLTVSATHRFGREGELSIAGTVAKATLVTPAEASSFGFPDNWTTSSLRFGGGYGAFGVNVTGQQVESPGQPKWESLGIGFTLRTPWSGALTVGAENVVTRGRNPFAPRAQDGEDEGTVPYVRYEQDL